MSKRILITGGSGFIGSRLVSQWLADGHQVSVYTRRPDAVRQRWPQLEQAASRFDDFHGPFDWLVNLAGEGIADQRWSEARKQVLRNSRIELTDTLAQWAINTGQRFEVVLSGSAIGIYGALEGTAEQQQVDEQSPYGSDFSANLCAEWEQAAAPLKPLAQRLVLLRTGVVLGPGGGMLKRLWLPFSLGLGGRIGSGEQYLSWIHMDDYLGAIDFLLHQPVEGAVNMTSPYAQTNAQFSRTLAATLKRPALLPVPGCPLKLALGEMSDLLLKGQKVQPVVLQQQGFEFHFPQLADALGDIRNHW